MPAMNEDMTLKYAADEFRLAVKALTQCRAIADRLRADMMTAEEECFKAATRQMTARDALFDLAAKDDR